MIKILVISDIVWKKSESLLKIIIKLKPDLLVISGDICQGSLPSDNGENFWNKLEDHNIMTLAVKGNYDYNARYEKIFFGRGYSFIRDISEQYFQFNGLTFLGIPFHNFVQLGKARSIGKNYPEKVDIVISHPSTARRIWAFDVNPKIVLMGHDDLRICKVLNTLLISTNWSPDNYAVLIVDQNQVKISYHQYRAHRSISGYPPWSVKEGMELISKDKLPEGYISYNAKWNFKTNSLTWLSKEHYCYHPPYIYSGRDKEYGNMLETILTMKQTKTKTQILELLPRLIKMNVTKSLLTEYLGISSKELNLIYSSNRSFCMGGKSKN
jgi:predicted phosphodiesterase